MSFLITLTTCGGLISHLKPSHPENVRTCFIHFLLAFLIDRTAADVRALLEKRGVLSSIFSDMIYDDCSIPVIQSIISVYNWKGPKNCLGLKRQKTVSDYMDSEGNTVSINKYY